MEYEIQSWKHTIPLYFTIQDFDIFWIWEISSGGVATREQLVNLDLNFFMDSWLIKWKKLGEEGEERWKIKKKRETKIMKKNVYLGMCCNNKISCEISQNLEKFSIKKWVKHSLNHSWHISWRIC